MGGAELNKVRVLLHAVGMAMITFGANIDGAIPSEVRLVILSTGLALNAAAVVINDDNGAPADVAPSS